MKNNFTFFSVALLITYLCTQSIIVGQWQKYIIDNTLVTPEVVAIGDLNGDTKPDIIVNDLRDNKIIWYENNYPNWNKHILDSNLAGAYVTDIGDLDGDGDLDVAASGYVENVVVWYENNHPVWIRHTIAENLTVSGAVSVADIDGDDTLDIVSSGYRNGGDVVWYENNLPDTIWVKHTIRSNYPTEWSWVGDIDGDGAVDVAVCKWHEGEVNWFKNENAGLSWTEFSIDDILHHASHLYFSDIDGDNDLDIAAAGAHDDVVVWYENNVANPFSPWIKYIIDSNLDEAWTVVVVDIDGDEKPDVAATSSDADKVVWYKNNHPEWKKQIIDANLNGALLLLSADIDNDNALDIIVPGSEAGNLVWYKNPTNMAYAVSLEPHPKYISPLGDTLIINAKLVNPEDHPAKIYAKITADEHAFLDSIQLFDDGHHGDGDASDNIWGGTKFLSGLEEDMYTMDLSINDLTTGTNYLHPFKSSFTTAGPVVVDSLLFEHFLGTLNKLQIHLRNDGSTTTADNITVKLNTADTNNVTKITTSTEGVDIPVGQTVEVGTVFITINGSPGTTLFNLTICSNGYGFWQDSFAIDLTPNDIEHDDENIPKVFALEQNYPNPFNPSTVINYSIPEQSYVSLKVFDVLGREVVTLANKEQPQGNYKVEFDASNLTSGIYFYRIQAGDFVETKKIILLR